MHFMRMFTIVTLLSKLAISAAVAQSALTIYNQNFAVVRDSLELDLKKGVTHVQVSDVTRHLEPESVIVRDPSGKTDLMILEQNYRADPVSQELLLSLFEGQEIPFQQGTNVVRGRIVRSGYTPHYQAMTRYGTQYAQRQYAYTASSPGGQPIVEVDGKIRFGLPGLPLFPSLADDTVLEPTLHWIILSPEAAKIDAELCYITGGMSWDADYNMIAPEQGDLVDVIGWVTIDNQSGRTFRDAKVKLMAGDVSKITQDDLRAYTRASNVAYEFSGMQPPVSEKTFDEYHLYTLEGPTTVRDRETKQVKFVEAMGVKSHRVYVYDGVKIDHQRYRGYSSDSIRRDNDYGTQCNPKVWVMRECENTAENNLGMALPQGRVRFYRRDSDAQLEFIGENMIDHTPRDETLRVYTGNAFDLAGERRRTYHKLDTSHNWLDEAFEIKVRNHKEQEEVEIRVVEHLYRWINWEIVEASHTYLQTDSQTIEFRVKPPVDGETVITYKVHYTW